MTPWLTVVGIGEDGFKGLGKNARHALLGAARIIGSERQLNLLPRCIRGERQLWPSPFSLDPLLALRGEPVCVLASGDPMFFGVGASLARQLCSDEMLILPAPSSYFPGCCANGLAIAGGDHAFGGRPSARRAERALVQWYSPAGAQQRRPESGRHCRAIA